MACAALLHQWWVYGFRFESRAQVPLLGMLKYEDHVLLAFDMPRWRCKCTSVAWCWGICGGLVSISNPAYLCAPTCPSCFLLGRYKTKSHQISSFKWGC